MMSRLEAFTNAAASQSFFWAKAAFCIIPLCELRGRICPESSGRIGKWLAIYSDSHWVRRHPKSTKLPAYFTHATWPCSRREIHNWFLPHKNRSGHVDLFSIYQSLWFETHPNRHQCQQWHAWRPAEILWDFVFQDSRIESLGFAMVRDGKY